MRAIRAGLAGLLLAAGLQAAGPQANAEPPDVTVESGFWRHPDRGPIFTYVRDTVPGQSSCAGPCLDVFSPLIADAGAAPGEEWTIEKQADGKAIWAFQGKPVYHLKHPEQHERPGSSALWLLLPALHWFPAGISIDMERFLVTADGQRLQTPSNGVCGAFCEAGWLPLKAPADAVSRQDWTVITQPDGAKVWAYGPTRQVVYLEQPGAPQAPTWKPGERFDYSAPRMVFVRAVRLARQITPIALTDGAYDLYDAAVTKRPVWGSEQVVPEYPAASRRSQEEGTTSMQVCVGPTGAVTSQTMLGSSGFMRLDAATEAWAPSVRFVPGEVNGKPAEICGYVFQLNWELSR